MFRVPTELFILKNKHFLTHKDQKPKAVRIEVYVPEDKRLLLEIYKGEGIKLPKEFFIFKDNRSPSDDYWVDFKNQEVIYSLHKTIENKWAVRVSAFRYQAVKKRAFLVITEYGYKGQQLIIDPEGRILVFVRSCDIAKNSQESQRTLWK